MDAAMIVPITSAAVPRSDKLCFCVDSNVVGEAELETMEVSEDARCELEIIVGSDPSRELGQLVTDESSGCEVDADLVEDVALDAGVGSGMSEGAIEMSAVSAFRN